MIYEAPAKLNLNLLVSARDQSGLHPIRSVVQAIEYLDTLQIERADDDSFSTRGDIEVPDGPENLVIRAIDALRETVSVPPLEISLDKSIPIAAGLGGGSADAAAALVGACRIAGKSGDFAQAVAPRVGADVSFPLIGGLAEMSGYGEVISPLAPVHGFAVAVVVPGIFLSTPAVYRAWDDLGGPAGFEVPDRLLPPVLRHTFPIRNDLYRAAVEVEPALGDFVSDVARLWDSVVMMTGSGAGCFGFFADVDEASEAAASVPGTRAAVGVDLRSTGVATKE